MVRIQGFAIVLALTAQASFAQTMYKCQNARKVEYSDRPCAGVEVKRLAPDGGPTPEDRARAKMRVAAEQERFAAQERQVAATRSGIANTLPDQGTSSAPDPDNEKVLTHSKSGWDRKTVGQIKAERAAARERAGPANQPIAPSAPAQVTNCDAGGCWDTSGQRYNGSGPSLVRADGRPCQRVSAVVYCN